MKILILLFTLLTTAVTQAYIPKFSTISKKIARSRSNKPIKVVQDVLVQDKSSGVTYSVRETLYIKNGDEIKISVQGKDLLKGQVKTSFIYSGKNKFALNGKKVSKFKTSSDFYTPLLYSKTPGGLKKQLIDRGMIPVNEKFDPNAVDSPEERAKESFTHLSRTNGGISYAITKALSTPNSFNPTVWVENKKFQVNKIRMNDNSVVSLRDYKKYNKRFFHPGEQVINWKNYKFIINTVSVSVVSKSKVASELRPSSLQKNENLTNFKSEALETFYSVFR